MMREKRQHAKLNNEGLSLVEIIIAMMILMVVTIPALNLMLVSAKYNQKAKEKQVVVSTAESVMEMFKAYSLEEICLKYNGGTTGLRNASTSVKGHNLVAVGGDDSAPVFASGQFIGSESDRYSFEAKNILTNMGQYDAVIEVNKTTLPGAGTDQMVLNIASPNEYTDAIYMAPYTWDDEAEQGMKEQIAEKISLDTDSERDDYTADEFDFANFVVMQRIMILDMQGTATACTGKVYVYYYYYYIVQDEYPDVPKDRVYGYYWLESLNGDAGLVFYDNTATGAEVQNVYFYYYPAYNGPADVVRMYSDLDNCPTFHVYKQKTPYTIPDLDIKDGAYNVILHYFELRAGKTEKPLFYHNMGINLSDMSKTTKNPIMGYSSGITRAEALTESVTIDYSLGVLSADDFGLELVREKPLIYSIEVKLYDSEDTAHANPLTVLNGTLNE